MGSWFFSRPKNRQREKIFHDVFANGCFGSISSAKNFGSSELSHGIRPFTTGDDKDAFGDDAGWESVAALINLGTGGKRLRAMMLTQ